MMWHKLSVPTLHRVAPMQVQATNDEDHALVEPVVMAGASLSLKMIDVILDMFRKMLMTFLLGMLMLSICLSKERMDETDYLL
jgi:hypothetical protein